MPLAAACLLVFWTVLAPSWLSPVAPYAAAAIARDSPASGGGPAPVAAPPPLAGPAMALAQLAAPDSATPGPGGSPAPPAAPGSAAAQARARVSTARPGWRAPLQPLVVRRFFEPPPEPWLPGHRGVDLAGHSGQVVRAAGAGEITFAGPLAGRGVVTVTHGTLRTTYEPVEPLVAVGDAVAAGDPIARLVPGHPPSSGFEARLHWGLLRGRTYLDPLLVLGRRQVRLLPVLGRSAAQPRDRSAAGKAAPRVPVAPGGPVRAGARAGASAAAGSGAARYAVAAGTSAVLAGAAVGAVRSSRARRRPP